MLKIFYSLINVLPQIKTKTIIILLFILFFICAALYVQLFGLNTSAYKLIDSFFILFFRRGHYYFILSAIQPNAMQRGPTSLPSQHSGLSPFSFVSFPLHNRLKALFVPVLTWNAWGVSFGVHYIAFLQ